MKKIIYSVYICVLLIACKDNSFDKFPYFEPQPITLEDPFVVFMPIKPMYSLLYTKKGILQAEESAGYISVIDLENNAFFSRTRLDDISGLYNLVGIYSPFSNSYYFFFSGMNTLYKLNKGNGTVTTGFQLNHSPAVILGECTKEGYLILSHRAVEDQGFRISILDTKNESILRDDIFYQSNNPWVFSCYDRETNFLFFTAGDVLANGDSFEYLFRIDLNSFSVEQLFSSETNHYFSDLKIYDDTILLVQNKLQVRDPVSEEWIVDMNKPSLIRIDKHNFEVIDIKFIFNNATTPFNCYKTFIINGEIYTVLAKSMIPGNPGFGETNFFKINEVGDFEKLKSECLWNLYWQDVIVRGNNAFFISYELSYIHSRMISLENLLIISDENIIIY